jgi:hypothetical protein
MILNSKYNVRQFAVDLVFYIFLSIFSIYILSNQTLDFINSDSLYLVILEFFGILGVSPPPSTYYFPDYFLFILTKIILSNPFERIIAAGFFQLFLLILIFRFFSSFIHNLAFIFILFALTPSLSITISFHLLSIVLFFVLLSAPKKVTNSCLIIFGLMDPLVLLAWSIFSFAKLAKSNLFEFREQAALIISWSLCYINGDFHPAHNKMFLMLTAAIFFSSLTYYSRSSIRLSRLLNKISDIDIFRIIMGIVIIILMMADQPSRYIVPLVGMALVNPVKKPCIENFFSANFFLRLLPLIPIFIAFLISFKVLSSKLDQYLKNYDCLINSLNKDKIHAVATDYWMSKFIFIRSNWTINVVPFNFEKGKPYIWISPYKMASEEFSFLIVRNECNLGSIHCGSRWLNSFAKYEKNLCGGYSLYKASEPIHFYSVSNKKDNLLQNLFIHIEKLAK